MEEQHELHSEKPPFKEIIAEKLQEKLNFGGEKINLIQDKIGSFSTKIIFIVVLTSYLIYFLKPFFL